MNFPEIILLEKKGVKIVLPSNPLISPIDGLHFFVYHQDAHQPYWQVENIKTLLDLAYYACGAANLIITAGFTPDFWANIQWNARPLFSQGANVFGRNPLSANWGRPVQFNQKKQKVNYSNTLIKRLKKNLKKYFDNQLGRGSLFSGGIKSFDKDSQEFNQAVEIFTTKKPTLKKKEVLWTNEKFIVVLPNQPHLTGLHLQIFPRFAYWKKINVEFRAPWQSQVKELFNGYMEMTAILIGIEKIILNKSNLKFFNPEIHFSSNWHKDLLPEVQGGKLSLDNIRKIYSITEEKKEKMLASEKNRYIPGGVDEFCVTGHGHLYATSSLRKYVKLPSRPFEEAPSEWKNIIPLPKDSVIDIRDLLQENLTPWLEKNCLN